MYPCIFFLFETLSRVHPTTLILSYSSFSLLFTMTPEQPSGVPQPGGSLAVASAAITHTHSCCAAAMVGATSDGLLVFSSHRNAGCAHKHVRS